MYLIATHVLCLIIGGLLGMLILSSLMIAKHADTALVHRSLTDRLRHFR